MKHLRDFDGEEEDTLAQIYCFSKMAAALIAVQFKLGQFQHHVEVCW